MVYQKTKNEDFILKKDEEHKMKITHIGSTVLILAAVTEVFSQRTCNRGFTGEDSGGSCSFSQSLCNWTSRSKNSQGWKLNTSNSHMQFNTYSKENEESALLISPLICDNSNATMCLKFNFKIISNDQRTLTLNLKCEERKCNDCLIWSRNTSTGRYWERECVDFKFDKAFKIVFEAKKEKGFYGNDADFSIDNITYYNTNCSRSCNSTFTSSSRFNLHSTTTAEYSTFTSNLSSATHSTSAPGTPLSDTNGESSTVTSNLPSTAHPTNAPGTAVAEVNTTHGKTTTTFYNTSTFMTTSVTNVAEKGVDHTLGIVLGSIALGLGAAVLIIVIVFRLRRRPGTHNPDTQREGTTIMIMNEIYVST